MRWPWAKKAAADPRVTPGDDESAYLPPSPYALSKWTVEQRAQDYREVFSGEVGQRVLYDLLHNVCGIGGNPRAMSKGTRGMPAALLPDPNGVLLSGNVGKQEVGYEILETLTLPLRDVIEGNRRNFG